MSSTALLDRFIDTTAIAVGTLLLIGIPTLILILAAIYLQRKILNRRIAQDRKQIGTNGYTALMHYAYFGKPHELKKLLADGESVNQTDNAGNTPLHYACGQKKFLNREAIAFLLSSGANREARNKRDKRPLDLLIHKSDKELVRLLSGESNLEASQN